MSTSCYSISSAHRSWWDESSPASAAHTARQHLYDVAPGAQPVAVGDEPVQSLISQITAPEESTAPTSATRPVIVPALCALSGCSIFIASRTTTRSPATTASPSLTAILTMVPCIGAVSESPDASAPDFRPADRFGAVFLAPPPPPPVPNPAGSDTSSRLPATSTTTVSRSPASSAAVAAPAKGAISLTNSVSIQRVCTRNGCAVNAGSSTTARWNGSAVAMPSTTNSESARRDRVSASSRDSPHTISLASSESNAPPITESGSTPESTRTPGPPGSTYRVTTPGAGRKPRPGS